MRENFLSDITLGGDTVMAGHQKNLSGPKSISYSGHGIAMPYSVGRNSRMRASMNERVNHRAASIVQSLETKAQRKALSLSAKLTPSLIFAGLVRGIIPTWMQKKSNQLTPDFATFKLDGEGAAEQREVK